MLFLKTQKNRFHSLEDGFVCGIKSVLNLYRICIKSIIIDCNAFSKDRKKSIILSKKLIILFKKKIF